jgi:hypothetical protein
MRVLILWKWQIILRKGRGMARRMMYRLIERSLLVRLRRMSRRERLRNRQILC